MRSRDTRLDVMFATTPDAKEMRAFAMSTNGVRTGTPTAATTADESQHEIDVVNHQVQHYRDVRSTRIERSQSVTIDEPRRLDKWQRRANRSVEPLDVTRLDERASACGDRQQLVGFRQSCGDRLLDE
jgi:hypothetical protein